MGTSTSYLNLCRSCNQDFASVKMFEKHRVGVHAYTYSEGARIDTPREDGRRCLTIEEMAAKGWEQNARGRWSDPVTITAARRAFGRGEDE